MPHVIDSGHVVQKENLDHTEEDGKDECLVPSDSDGESNLIMDDILRDILVDRLPQGCQLVAILDSCHSGSLLDLDHYRCNRVWVPWASKGRRKSDSLRNDVQRRNALVVIQNKRISDDRVKQCKTTLHPNPLAPLSFQRRTSKENSIPPTSPVASPTFTSAHKKLTRALTNLNAINALRPSPTRDSVGPKVAKTRLSKTIKSQFIPWLDIEKATSGIGGEEYQDELRRCESPVQDFCSGWCRSSVATPKSSQFPGAPEIISLASCKDSQEAWEVGEEHSMTQMLVEILKKDPNPTLKDLMVTVSHKLHNAAMSAHAQTKMYKKKMVRHRARNPGKRKRTLGDTYGLNMNEFQDPQLSSTKPLDMGKRWNL
jgi:metacaspase-1